MWQLLLLEIEIGIYLSNSNSYVFISIEKLIIEIDYEHLISE